MGCFLTKLIKCSAYAVNYAFLLRASWGNCEIIFWEGTNFNSWIK